MKKLNSILLIEDNEVDIFIIKKILESCGATNILSFSNTITALQYLRQATAIPKIIFLDIYLPLIDGFEFLEEFQKLEIAKHPIDIYILTNSINPADKERARKKNCAGFISKPLTPERLWEYFEISTEKKSIV